MHFFNIFSINEDVFSLNVQAFFCDSYLKRGHLRIPFVPVNKAEYNSFYNIKYQYYRTDDNDTLFNPKQNMFVSK